LKTFKSDFEIILFVKVALFSIVELYLISDFLVVLFESNFEKYDDITFSFLFSEEI
jgi:hypothetical protein